MSISFLSTIHESTNLGGDTMLLSLAKNQRYQLVRPLDLYLMGLFKKVSSSRVYSSSEVDATAIYFDGYNFSGNFVQLTNLKNSGQPEDIVRLSDLGLDNVAQSVLLVGRESSGAELRLSFRTFFLDEWKAVLDQSLLGSRAQRIGDPILTWEMFPQGISGLSPDLRFLKIVQFLNIDLPAWPDYDASITFHVLLFVNQQGNLEAEVAKKDFWVSSGLKQSAIIEKIAPKVDRGAADLNTKLKVQLGAFRNFKFKDVYFLPGEQLARTKSGTISGNTVDDVTIVLVV